MDFSMDYEGQEDGAPTEAEVACSDLHCPTSHSGGGSTISTQTVCPAQMAAGDGQPAAAVTIPGGPEDRCPSLDTRQHC